MFATKLVFISGSVGGLMETSLEIKGSHSTLLPSSGCSKLQPYVNHLTAVWMAHTLDFMATSCYGRALTLWAGNRMPWSHCCQWVFRSSAGMAQVLLEAVAEYRSLWPSTHKNMHKTLFDYSESILSWLMRFLCVFRKEKLGVLKKPWQALDA